MNINNSMTFMLNGINIMLQGIGRLTWCEFGIEIYVKMYISMIAFHKCQ